MKSPLAILAQHGLEVNLHKYLMCCFELLKKII